MHTLVDGAGFSACDCVCEHGRHSPTVVGEYRRTRVGVNLIGAFHVRSSGGDALIGPNAMLLGNAGAAYEFRHVDDGGDRSIVFEYDDAFLDEIARSVPRVHRECGAFRRALVPGSPAATEAVVLAREALRGGDVEALREAALAAAGVALIAGRDVAPDASAWSMAQVGRVARTLRYIEANLAGDCSLEALAAHAGLSRYHFLRVFRAMTGQTPRQHVIATRLRSAATVLKTTRKPITEIALEVGFGDLSHFTNSFSQTFGASPRAYHKRESTR